MCHSSAEELRQAALELIENLLIKRGGETLNTAEMAELSQAWDLLDELRQPR